MLLWSVVLLIGLAGCSINRVVVIHPIEKEDIFSIEKGAQIIHTDKRVDVVKKDGWFLSDYYLEEVAKARVKE